MKRYAAWGVDRSFRWKWQAKLAQWWYWRKRKLERQQEATNG